MRHVPALVVAALLASAPAAWPCAVPPIPTADVVCGISASRTVLRVGESAVITVTVTNTGDPRDAPPYNEDVEFAVWTTLGRTSFCGAHEVPGGAPDFIEPTSALVVLDDARSSSSDDPSTASVDFLFTPFLTGGFVIGGQVRGQAGGTILQCFTDTLCIDVIDGEPDLPSVRVSDPVTLATAGDEVRLTLDLERNAFPSAAPLGVRVTAVNAADPQDVFPVEVPDDDFEGSSGSLEIVCRVPGACFPGVNNEYHVRLLDGPVTVWDSRWWAPDGLARIAVAEVPPLQHVVVGVQDDTGDGALTTCEEGTILVRATVRNPHFDGDLESCTVTIPLPDALELVSWDLHHHDNPLDSETPTPAELDPGATVDVQVDRLVIHVPRIEPREVQLPSGPRVFRDLVDIDLLYRIPDGGVGLPEVHLPAPDLVTATLSATAPEIVIPIGDAVPPSLDFDGVRPLRLRRDGLLTWASRAETGAASFDVLGGSLELVRAGEPVVDCLVPRTTESEAWVSLAEDGPEALLVGARNCAGDSTLGRRSDAVSRPFTPCP